MRSLRVTNKGSRGQREGAWDMGGNAEAKRKKSQVSLDEKELK